MRQRIIKTEIVRDQYFLSLQQDEQRFFLQFLIVPNVEMTGIFMYTDRDMLFDMPFFNQERISILKKKFESDGKIYFYDGWVWIRNFSKNNFFNSFTQIEGMVSQLKELKRCHLEILKHFEMKGFTMPDLTDYIIQKQRNKVKKEIKKERPNLFGQNLEREVDRIMGVVHTGKMDWAALVGIVKKTEQSDFPTPESINKDHVYAVASEYKTRPYKLYWFFLQKIEKLKSSGRTKYDYMALLKGCVTSALKKDLSDPEKKSAVILFSQFIGEPIDSKKADLLIFTGEI